MPRLVSRIVNSGLANLAIRGATLFFRFALSFYLVSFLGLEAAGIYGLAVGAIGIVPAALGWGLNYFLAREVVGLMPHDAALAVRDRLRITLTSLTIATVIAVPVLILRPTGLSDVTILILALLWLETFALDVYMPMIGLELALQANILVFVRSAAWIPVVIGLGIASPAFRSLDLVFGLWIASHLIAIGLLVVFLRHWPIRAALDEPFERRAFLAQIRRSWYIYLSDLGLVGLVYADRFIVNAMLGLAATGAYSFYWSITNALQTLIATAVVQVALPRMIRAFRGGVDTWRAELRAQMTKALGYAIGLSITIFGATEAIIRLSPPGKFPQLRGLLVLLLLASVIRASSDLLNVAITSTGRDRIYALTNIGGVFLTIGLSVLFLSSFGLIGAALSALTTALALLLVRGLYLRHVMRRSAAT